MALVSELKKKGENNRRKIHEPISGEYDVFETPDGKLILQIDTRGRDEREIPGKLSQTMQFDETRLRQLKSIIDAALLGRPSV